MTDDEMAARLAGFLREQLPGRPPVTVSGLERIVGGASRETWTFDASWTAGGAVEAAGFVLRKDPPASNLVTDRALEFAFYSAFADSAVPVPRMRWLERDPALLGSPFFIMDRIDGCDSSPFRLRAPEYATSGMQFARQMYAILADIARLEWRGTPIASFVGFSVGTADMPPQDCWRAQLDHWEAIIDENELSPQPITRAAIRRLRAQPPPPPARVAVVHGDFRTGNFLYRPDGIVAVVDWEMGHVGDPLEDLAWSLLDNWEWFGDGLKGGILEAAEAVSLYEAAVGVKVDPIALRWWELFSSVKAQGIWLTAARSFDSGRTDELSMAMMGILLCNRQDEIMLRALERDGIGA